MQENLIAASALPQTPPRELTAFPQTIYLMGRGLTAPSLGPSGLAPNSN